MSEQIDKPIGKVSRVNEDGTLAVDLDMSNPDVLELVAAWLAGQQELTNQTLAELKAKGTN